MTYRPAESFFAAPWPARVPSLAYLALALGWAGLVLLAEQSPSNSWLYVKLVEEDVHHIVSARTMAAVLLFSAVASVARASMRGVRIRGDSVEFRDVVTLGWPKVKRYKWAQIDRILLDRPQHVAFDLWDGTQTSLPRVGNHAGLSSALEKVAHARAIPVRGGHGLDELPDSGEFDAEGE
jgi:hypothetical protein